MKNLHQYRANLAEPIHFVTKFDPFRMTCKLLAMRREDLRLIHSVSRLRPLEIPVSRSHHAVSHVCH